VKIINFQILTISVLVLLASVLLVFLIQIYYLLSHYLKLALHKDSPSSENSSQVTIIVPVRNEEERIREILNNFNEQEFQDYQLLVMRIPKTIHTKY